MTTAAFADKRTIVDEFIEYTGPGLTLDGVQVEYSFPAAPTDTLIYGGRVSFEQNGDDDLVNGDDVAVAEVATIWLYVRVTSKPTVREAEAEAERIGDVMGSIIRKNPRMCGPTTSLRIAGGTSDHHETDDNPQVLLAYRIIVTAYV
jgi:hypothetical protein